MRTVIGDVWFSKHAALVRNARDTLTLVQFQHLIVVSTGTLGDSPWTGHAATVALWMRPRPGAAQDVAQRTLRGAAEPPSARGSLSTASGEMQSATVCGCVPARQANGAPVAWCHPPIAGATPGELPLVASSGVVLRPAPTCNSYTARPGSHRT